MSDITVALHEGSSNVLLRHANRLHKLDSRTWLVVNLFMLHLDGLKATQTIIFIFIWHLICLQ